jgi:hypothetical protein
MLDSDPKRGDLEAMPRANTNLLQILKLNRGPVGAVAAELSPYLGCAFYGPMLASILSGASRQSLREAIGDKPWRFGLASENWFSNVPKTLDFQVGHSEIVKAGYSVFCSWLVSEPSSNLTADELEKAVKAAVSQVAMLPVPAWSLEDSKEASFPCHQKTTPILNTDQNGSRPNAVFDPSPISPCLPSNVSETGVTSDPSMNLLPAHEGLKAISEVNLLLEADKKNSHLDGGM